MGEGGEEKGRGVEEVMVSPSIHPSLNILFSGDCSRNEKQDER